MTATPAFTADSAIDRIFGPVIQPQTWINVLYLLASFPLGLLYFVVLCAIFSTGLGLIPIFVGLFILWAGLAVVNAFAELDRLALNLMLRAAIPPRKPAPPAPGGMFDRMLADAHRPGTLRRFLYLFLLRMPMGIASFVLVMVLAPVSLILLTLPLTYTMFPVIVGADRVQTFDEAIYLCCFGAVMTVLSIHVMNSWAGFCRRLGQWMLR